MKTSLSTGAVVLGVALLAVSLLWGVLFPAKASWTEDKAKRLAELTQKAHNLMFEANAAQQKPSTQAGKNSAGVQEEYRKVSEELTTLRTEFEGKRDSPKTASTILRWSGIAFVVAGAIIVFANRDA
jgi:hypothetical protein